MEPLKITELYKGEFSLILIAGASKVEDDIMELDHEPNGYFWEGVATWLIQTEAKEIEDLLEFDPESAMFCAYSSNRHHLEKLGTMMAEAATKPEVIRTLISKAEKAGIDFDGL